MSTRAHSRTCVRRRSTAAAFTRPEGGPRAATSAQSRQTAVPPWHSRRALRRGGPRRITARGPSTTATWPADPSRSVDDVASPVPRVHRRARRLAVALHTQSTAHPRIAGQGMWPPRRIGHSAYGLATTSSCNVSPERETDGRTQHPPRSCCEAGVAASRFLGPWIRSRRCDVATIATNGSPRLGNLPSCLEVGQPRCLPLLAIRRADAAPRVTTRPTSALDERGVPGCAHVASAAGVRGLVRRQLRWWRTVSLIRGVADHALWSHNRRRGRPASVRRGEADGRASPPPVAPGAVMHRPRVTPRPTSSLNEPGGPR